MLSLTRLHRNIRSLRRYRQVLGVLVKYGFGQILDQLPLGHLLERGRQLLSRRPSRRTLEQLTPDRKSTRLNSSH
jgi:ubiquinone biosynthesis protein